MTWVPRRAKGRASYNGTCSSDLGPRCMEATQRRTSSDDKFLESPTSSLRGDAASSFLEVWRSFELVDGGERVAVLRLATVAAVRTSTCSFSVRA
jgi:hypothetical protein